ncbi:M12 family metallopeptidase [Burkholderia cenocepacia]|uniref:M12 family metallopeptidase n=1 Tax=Burkholderia cenocepacia TaxID=95486 RepID=UPI00158DB799|nr:M12 family metallopeptidase [Burkholderia cenocepacia]
MTKLKALGIGVGLASLLASGPGRADEQGYVLGGAVWKQSSIPVCWINPTTSDTSERAWVQRAVERTWARNSQAYFTGWGQCPSTNAGNAIRIRIADVGPYASALGKFIVNSETGMALNFAFQNWSPACRASDTSRRQCIESIAVHEFGHALGFAHEQNRPDTPTATCKDSPQGSNGDIMIGAWDLNSVMNYCNPTYNGAGALSSTDLQTVQTFYKAPLRDDNFAFDAEFYLSHYPDLRNAFGADHQAALNHWKTSGIAEGRRASREFDVTYYLSRYPDLYQAFRNDYAAALNHWVTYGIREGRQGSREVDVQYYLAKYEDVRGAFGNDYRAALSHWIRNGFNEQRQASAEFGLTNYFNRYPDLRDAFKYTNSFSSYANDAVLGFNHWIEYGITEGRNGR